MSFNQRPDHYGCQDFFASKSQREVTENSVLLCLLFFFFSPIFPFFFPHYQFHIIKKLEDGAGWLQKWTILSKCCSLEVKAKLPCTSIQMCFSLPFSFILLHHINRAQELKQTSLIPAPVILLLLRKATVEAETEALPVPRDALPVSCKFLGRKCV